MKNPLHKIGLLTNPKQQACLALRAIPPLPLRAAALALALVLALCTVIPALARAGWIPTQQVIEDDLFLVGESHTISGRVKGNLFALGRDVHLEGEVEGSLFVLADQLTLDGRVAGSVYAGALTLRQNANSQVGQSLYAAALNLVTERGAAIGRDLRTVAVSANLRGSVARYTQARIGLLELWRTLRRGITGGITGLPSPVPVTVSQPVRWTIYASAGLPALMMNWALVYPQDAAAPAPSLEILTALLALLLIGGATLWLFPGAYARAVEQAHHRPLASIAAGAVILVNGFLMPALITILVGSAFFGLIFLSIPDLAWMLFGVGFGVTVTAFSLFLLAMAYLSKAIVASLVGGLILNRFLPRFAAVRLLPLLLGLLIYIVLVSIPYLGFTIGLLGTMIGLGAMWLARRPALPSPAAVAEAIQPPAPAAETAGSF